MQIEKHGLSVGIEQYNDDIFILIKPTGKLTHGDYKMTMPIINLALNEVEKAKVKVLINATEMEGWEPEAAWDNLKLELKQGKKFQKIAIYGDKEKQKKEILNIGSWFTSGETKYFDNEPEAVTWLLS